MNLNGRFYPDGCLYHKKDGVWKQSYRGAASAILTQEEAEVMKDLLDPLFDERMPEELTETLEELSHQLLRMVEGAEERMKQLHKLFGAYDMDEKGSVSKPESEKIDWDKLDRESNRKKTGIKAVK